MAQMNTDIVTLLSANGREVSYSYKLLDHAENERTGINLRVKKCQVRYSSLDDLKCSATVNMKDDSRIDYENDRIQIFCNIKVPKIGTFSYSLGIFLMSAPKRSILSALINRDVNCYSKLKLLYDKKVDTTYRLSKGANVRNAIISLLGTHNYILPESNATMPSNREWQAGSTSISIINDLLSDYMGCTSLYVTNEGCFASRIYVLPADRTIDFTYTNQSGNLKVNMEEEIDTFSIPNKFTSYTSSSTGESLYYTYINNNVESITSVTSRYGRIVSETPVQVDCSTLAELEKATKKRANEASSTYAKITWYTKVIPLHNYLNCCYVANDNVQGKYIETSWVIDSSKGTMEHNGRKSIAV
nr:MAG TPA: protein of unknown function (DUF5047) [Caudoviricetes sp.]